MSGEAPDPSEAPHGLTRRWRVARRLVTFALARLRHRRGLAVLAASGAALSVAMLTSILVVGSGIEDQTFRASLGVHTANVPGSVVPSNAIFIGTRITANAGAIQAFVSARLRKEKLPFQASAIIGLPSNSLLVMSDRLPDNFVLERGRFPRSCSRIRCEYIENGAAPAQGFVPAAGETTPQIPGYRMVDVGRAYQQPASILTVPPGTAVLVAGFALVADQAVSRGNGVLQWGAPSASIARHPWEVSSAIATLTRVRSELARRTDALGVDDQFDSLTAARAGAAAGSRRLLVIAGAMLGVFMAFQLFAATRLRRDTDLLRERLAVVNASRSQIRLLTLIEFLLSSLVGAFVGLALGAVLGGLLVRRLGTSGTAAVIHTLGVPANWVYWLTVLAISLASLSLVASPPRVVGRGRSVALPELTAVVALVLLVIGFSSGGLSAHRLGSARWPTVVFVVLVPLLLAIVVAVAGMRLVTPIFSLVGHLGRRLGPSARLAALRVARDPGDAALVVGFVGAVLGLAVFLGIYRATLVRNQNDQVLYQAPADALVSEDLSQLVPVNSVPIGRFPGQIKTPVLRVAGDVPQLAAGGGFTLLGLPAPAVTRLAGWRSDFSTLSPQEISRRLTPKFEARFRSIPLPPGKTRLSLALRSRGDPVDISATLLSRTGNFGEVEIGDSTERTLTIAVPPEFRGGSLVGFVFRPGDVGVGSARIGELLDDVAVGSLEIGPVPWIDFRSMAGVDGIDPRAAGHSVAVRYAVGTTATGRLRLRQPTDGKFVDVIVSPKIARAAGARGILPLDILGTQILTRVVGTAAHFPTLDGNFIVADRETVGTALNAADPGPPFYNELWIDDHDPARLATELERPVLRSMTIVNRSTLRTTARLSLVVRAARDLLAIASLLAVCLGIAGIVLAIASDVRARRWELLDLSAQGVDRRGLTRFLRLRLLLSCAFASLVALVTGIGLATATARLLKVAADVEQPNPPLIVTVQWLLLGAAAAAVTLVVFGIVTAMVRGQLRRLEAART